MSSRLSNLPPSTIYTTTKPLPDGGKLVIKVRMDDQCGNGHADFAITATEYDEKGRDVCGGCMHEEILKAAPELRPFVNLHLNDATTGAPMYALENGFYFYELALGRKADGYKTSAHYSEALRDHLMLSNAELAAIMDAKLEDVDHFHWYLDTHGCPARWQKAANEARALLFQLVEKGDTGAERNKWADYVPQRKAYAPLSPEKREALEKRLAEGYYTDEAKAKRAQEAAAAKKAARLAELEAEMDKGIKKLTDEYLVRVALVHAGVVENRHGWIYYDHTNTLCANWSKLDAVSQEQFDAVVAAIHNYRSPKVSRSNATLPPKY